MGIIEAELARALSTPVKRKRNATLNLRAAADRLTKKSNGGGGPTEVMVKITGFGKGAGHVAAHLNYIDRNGKVELESDKGEILSGKEAVRDFFSDWEKDFADSNRPKDWVQARPKDSFGGDRVPSLNKAPRVHGRRDTMHMVLSMPKGTNPEAVRSAVRSFAKTNFGKNHEYVFALHTDEPHPHCHLSVKCQGFNGKRLNPRKADLQQWRESFAEKLRAEGVDAEATPRRSRGVVKKPERGAVHQMERERGDKAKARTPRKSKAKALTAKEMATELSAEIKGVKTPVKPWEDAIKVRQEAIRAAWRAAADALEKERPGLTFKGKEQRNERPDYDRINGGHARADYRAALVYQSNIKRTGRQVPPEAIASVRNLSGVPVVHHTRADQMLLQANASDRLGRGGNADSQMRRPRTGTFRDIERGKRLDRGVDTAAVDKALASRIRGFVDAMPSVITANEETKQKLIGKFVKSVAKDKGVESANAAGFPNNGKDMER